MLILTLAAAAMAYAVFAFIAERLALFPLPPSRVARQRYRRGRRAGSLAFFLVAAFFGWVVPGGLVGLTISTGATAIAVPMLLWTACRKLRILFFGTTMPVPGKTGSR